MIQSQTVLQLCYPSLRDGQQQATINASHAACDLCDESNELSFMELHFLAKKHKSNRLDYRGPSFGIYLFQRLSKFVVKSPLDNERMSVFQQTNAICGRHEAAAAI